MNVLQNLDFPKAIKELFPKLMGNALYIVILATIFGFLLAITIGFLLAIGRISKKKVLNKIIIIFQEIVRGTPLLVQLVYMYYVVPLLITLFANLIGFKSYNCHMSSLTAGILGLGINYGTYISEVIRASILSIDNGQSEAALALGLTPMQVMLRIIIPQALRNSIPVFGNYLVMMVKDTSLMAYITVQEFLMTTKAYTSQTFLTIESYTILAVVYLCICIPLGFLAKYMEKKFKQKNR
jgi:polar amino acid transport system permease protein